MGRVGGCEGRVVGERGAGEEWGREARGEVRRTVERREGGKGKGREEGRVRGKS